ncbi:hypothetical protein [Chryseobacterium sp. MP_3.2]|uniref:hypothetical protein n=1 Tax=Chryseobacterium sp. MP_3.2 TaxID=3071712 RepID=UPI002E03A2E5|nr:hypothetical protein [Chryseobacterium sp. MP_3.2]
MPAISKVTPTSQTIYWDRTGAIPSITPLDVIVMESETVEYVQFYIDRISGNVDWLTSENLGEYLPLGGGLIPLNLMNLDQLYPGNYQSKVDVFISNSLGFEKQLTSIVNLNITGNPPIAITTDKTNYDVVYIRSTNAFSGDTDIDIVNNTDGSNIEFSTIGNLFKEGIATSAIILEEDPAFPFSTNAELPAAGIKVVNCRLKKDGVYVYNFTVTIAVIEDDEIITDPEFLDFKLRKGYNETQSKVVQIINPLNKNFTITGPDWLNFDVTAGNSTLNLTVTTDNSEMVPVGVYSGNIQIAYDGKIAVVPVTLLVVEFISIPDRNFCLDDIILTATRQNETAKILRITMTATFHTNEKQVQNLITYDVMYQNGFVKTDIGTKVHRMFPRNRKSSFLLPKTKPFENILVYKPAQIILKIEELDINYVVSKTVNLPALYLYPGKKPKMYPLFTNHNIRRRVDQSAYIFSYMANLITPANIVGSAAPSNPVISGEVYTVKIEDSDNLITWTDKKTILGVDYYKLKQSEPIQVEWQNQNLVPEWFCFTGEFTKTKDKTHIYQENSFTENIEKMEVRNSRPFKLNTGFILKAEAALLDELIDSKLCFLKIEGKTFEAFAISNKFIEEDSALELYQYEVEFLIIKEI